MVTVPKSPDAAPAAPPAASVIMPLKDVTFKSELAVLPSTTTQLNISEIDPEPLAYVAVAPLSRASVGVPLTTTASSQVAVILRVSPTP